MDGGPLHQGPPASDRSAGLGVPRSAFCVRASFFVRFVVPGPSPSANRELRTNSEPRTKYSYLCSWMFPPPRYPPAWYPFDRKMLNVSLDPGSPLSAAKTAKVNPSTLLILHVPVILRSFGPVAS